MFPFLSHFAEDCIFWKRQYFWSSVLFQNLAGTTPEEVKMMFPPFQIERALGSAVTSRTCRRWWPMTAGSGSRRPKGLSEVLSLSGHLLWEPSPCVYRTTRPPGEATWRQVLQLTSQPKANRLPDVPGELRDGSSLQASSLLVEDPVTAEINHPPPKAYQNSWSPKFGSIMFSATMFL